MVHYHAHITLDAPVAPPKGWKATEIHLSNEERNQVDFMLTRHAVSARTGINLINEIIALVPQLEGIKRIKIEQDNKFFKPITTYNYLECHMLLPADTRPATGGWVKSKNPKYKDGSTFYNKRLYEGSSMEEEIHSILNYEIATPYLDIKFEQVIYDSNRGVDEWWA